MRRKVWWGEGGLIIIQRILPLPPPSPLPNLKSSHPLSTIPPRRSIIKQSDFNSSFFGGKPRDIEIGFPDNNSKFRTEFNRRSEEEKKHNHHKYILDTLDTMYLVRLLI